MKGRLLVPFAVAEEILAAGDVVPGAREFLGATWLERKADVVVSSYLSNSLHGSDHFVKKVRRPPGRDPAAA